MGWDGRRTMHVVLEDGRLVDCREVTPREDVQQRSLAASTVTSVPRSLVVSNVARKRKRASARICVCVWIRKSPARALSLWAHMGLRDQRETGAFGVGHRVYLQQHQLALDGLGSSTE
jgi:hypothetical protein